MNPLALESNFFAIQQTNIYQTVTKYYQPSDGIVRSTYEVSSKITKEQQQKTSVYINDEINSKLFTNFSSNSRSLILYLIYNLKSQKDFIKLNPRQVQKIIYISPDSYKKAINQLIDEKLIYPKSITIKSEEYWINPHYMFKGARLLYFIKNYPNQIITIQGDTTKLELVSRECITEEL